MRSGELLGRMLFFNTSIQLRLIPAVMADNVKVASRVCRTKEDNGLKETGREASEEEEEEGRRSGRDADTDVSRDNGLTTTTTKREKKKRFRLVLIRDEH